MPESTIQRKSFAFALQIIKLYSKLGEQHEYVLAKQLLRSGTSIGANVEEARETRYWLRLLRESDLVELDVTNELNSVDELIRILTSIVKTTSEGI